MTVVDALLVVLLVYLAWLLWPRAARAYRALRPVPTPAQIDEVADGDDGDPLVVLRRVEARLTLAESFNRALRRVVFVLIGFAAAGLAVAVVLGLLVVDSRQRSDERDRDQTAARRGSCVQYNVTQSNTREAIVGGVVGGFRPFVTPDGQAQLDEFSAALRAQVEAILPYRDCSDAGIRAFLEDPPPDPASPTTQAPR